MPIFNHSLITCCACFQRYVTPISTLWHIFTHKLSSPQKPSQTDSDRHTVRILSQTLGPLAHLSHPSVCLSCILYNYTLTWYLLTVLAPFQSHFVSVITRRWSVFDLAILLHSSSESLSLTCDLWVAHSHIKTHPCTVHIAYTHK